MRPSLPALMHARIGRNRYLVDRVIADHGSLILTPPIEFRLHPKRGFTTYTCNVADLESFAVSVDVDVVLAELASNIMFNWCEYVECDESELTNGALQLRATLLARMRWEPTHSHAQPPSQ